MDIQKKKSLRIAIDVRMIESSGIGTYLQNILSRLIVQQQSWTFYLLGNGNCLSKNGLTHYPNVQLVEFKSKLFSFCEQLEFFIKIPKNIDLFWSPHFVVPVFYFNRLVTTIHDVLILAKPEFVKGVFAKAYANIMLRLACMKSNRIMTVSEFSKLEIMKFLHFPETQIDVVKLGVDARWFSIPRKTKLLDKPFILCVGNLKPHKNLKVVLEAFNSVKDNIPYDIVLVGKKDGLRTKDLSLEQLLSKLGERVHVTGYIEQTQLEQYYRQAAVFIFPSLYEGFGLPPLEALAAGCPRVLCSNIASIPEVCSDMVEYFDPKEVNQLASLLTKSAQVLDKNRDNIKQRIGYSYDWNKTTQQTIESFYRSLTDTKGRK